MSDNWQEAVLGETSGVHAMGTLSELQAVSCQMAFQCRRELRIYSQRLNREIYEQHCFLEAAKLLAIRHANTKVSILVADTEHIRVNGHRLLELARKLPSSVQIRRRSEEFAYDLRSFMLADEGGFILRPIWYDFNDATASFHDRYMVRGLKEDFVRVWEQSEPDPALRQLSI